MNINLLIELEKEIGKYDDTLSHLRIGQIICNSLNITCPELYYLTNKQLENKIQTYIKDIRGI